MNFLTKRNIRFKWTEACEKSFRLFIEKLTSPPVLSYPKFDLPFILTTDASNVGLGAVLSQVQNGEERDISFASRSLKPAEKNYSVIERELLAIVWATSLFRPYLYNAEFTVVTDHNPLVYLNNLTIHSNRLTKWRLRLAEFKFTVKYKKGAENVNADSLSRVEMSPEVPVDENISSLFEEEEHGGLVKEIRLKQREDPEVACLVEEAEKRGGKFNNYLLENEVLFCCRKSKRPYESVFIKRLVVPVAFREDVMRLCHDSMCGGHLGEKKTWWKLSDRFYWPSAYEDTLKWVESCSKCSARKAPPNNRSELMPITEFSSPFEMVGVDILGPLPLSESGNKYVVVFTDYLTKWPEAFALKDMKAETIARVFVDEIICRHSASVRLLSDQGRNFMSDLLKEVCRYFDTKKINSTSYRPQTNGLTERFNRTLCEMLSNYVNDGQSDWDSFLPIVLFAYRASRQSSTGESPFRLLYSRMPRLPSDLDCGNNCNLVIDLKLAWKEAKERLIESAAKEKKRHEPAERVVYRVGDRVRVFMPACKVGLNQKLRANKWHGPFTV